MDSLNGEKILTVAGIGPGGEDGMTAAARRAIENAELVVGYDLYVNLVKQFLPEKQYYSTPMRSERERVEYAVRSASEGTETVLICSGDPGVYGMASLAMDTADRLGLGQTLEIRILPGVTAALSAAALAGSPFTCDFAVINLSDLMFPRELIRKRLEAAAQGDFAIALYNPGSKKRTEHLAEACRIIARYRSGNTVCAIAENIGRAEERCRLLTLDELAETTVGMTSTVLIGNSFTKELNGRMVTPRGYADEYRTTGTSSASDPVTRVPEQNDVRGNILLFGGTQEGRELTEMALRQGFRVTVSVVTEYGKEVLQPLADGNISSAEGSSLQGDDSEKTSGKLRILQGKMPPDRIRELLQSGTFDCVIDATHPYAAHITDSIRMAAQQTEVPYFRVNRTLSDEAVQDLRMNPEEEWIRYFPKMEMIIDYLNEHDGRVFFSTGSAGAEQYARMKNAKQRSVIRVLPLEEAISACRAAGFSGKNLICMQGPFDEEMNKACFRFAKADYLVTKSSGVPGGFDAKIRAARSLEMNVLVLEPPAQTDGMTLEEMKERLRAWKRK